MRGLIQPHETHVAPTRSNVERRMLKLIEEAGLPKPLVNHKLGPYMLDFAWLDQRVVLEMDTYATHGDRHDLREGPRPGRRPERMGVPRAPRDRQPGRREDRGPPGGDPQSLITSSRPSARSNRSRWRSAAHRATVTSEECCSFNSTRPSTTDTDVPLTD